MSGNYVADLVSGSDLAFVLICLGTFSIIVSYLKFINSGSSEAKLLRDFINRGA